MVTEVRADALAKAEWVEMTRRQAVDAYNARDLPGAERLFFRVIEVDPASPSSIFSLDHLVKIVNEAGYVREAISQFEIAKKTSEEARKYEYWNPERQTILERSGGKGGFLDAIFSAISEAGLNAARTLVVSHALDLQGLAGVADFYFDRAGEEFEKAQDKNFKFIRGRYSVRPLHYRLSPHLERSVGLRYTPPQTLIVPFLGNAALTERQEMALGVFHKRKISFDVAVKSEYDSNVPRVKNTTLLPPNVNRKQGMAQTYFFRGGVNTIPGQNWVYGGDYRAQFLSHPRSDLAEYNRRAHALSGWVSWWNKRDTEARGRYDIVLGKRALLHGPQFAGTRLFNERYQLDAFYALTLSTYTGARPSGDWRRSSLTHAAGAGFAYPGKDNQVQPYLRLAWERQGAHDMPFNVIRYSFEGGSSYLIGEKAVVRVSTVMDILIFPHVEPESRADQAKEFRLDGSFPLFTDYVVLSLDSSYRLQSSALEEYTHNRFGFGAALAILVDF